MFLLCLFWGLLKKTTSNAALFVNDWRIYSFNYFQIHARFYGFIILNPMGFVVPNADGVYEIPFIDRMGFVF